MLSTCSIAILLSCCAGLKKFPTDTLYEYDAVNKVCGQYKIVDFEHFKFEFVKDVACPSVFGFSAQDIPKVLNWAQDAQDYARQHCQ
jgi:hypothetical protein